MFFQTKRMFIGTGAMMMRGLLTPICCLLLAVVLTTPSAAPAAQDACAQIRAACQRAGFTSGGARDGSGLQVDCVMPIMQGAPQPKRASKALPQIDPQLVDACKESNPRFGQGRGQPAPPPTTPASPAAAPSAPPPAAASGERPNIVFILTDDLAWNLVQYMPHVLQMQKDGATFSSYFVTDSLCCPSRSSIFTGRFPHDTGIFRNTGADGGFRAFHSRHQEQATFATALQAAGYRTAMLGKYLNGYEPAKDAPEPGWNLWAVADNGYPEFNYNLNQDGNIVRYGNQPTDYLTDVASHLAVNFIKQSAGAPFMIEIATFAPHAPYVPAPRDADAFPGLRAPRTAAFNAAVDASAPQWLRTAPALSTGDIAKIDADFRRRAQSVQAVDAMIGELQAAVEAIGQERNTYFVFSSDNGYHMGEYRLMPGKMTAFDTDIRVPLIITGPGIAAGLAVSAIAENIDLCPTFSEIGGASVPANVDGLSLLPLLRGQTPSEWRKVALVEHHGPVRNLVDPDFPGMRSGNPTTYEAIRGSSWLYVEYADGEREYHDLATDPDELHNTYPALSNEEKASLHATVAAVQSCHDAQACMAADHALRDTAARR
jgi:N-acetylglucosamine-6-sulfatase